MSRSSSFMMVVFVKDTTIEENKEGAKEEACPSKKK
ncbi:MAG: hypothetical protein ACI865_000571 [Flavobacteriaceae bacterium]|jgi:hypothetical protein